MSELTKRMRKMLEGCDEVAVHQYGQDPSHEPRIKFEVLYLCHALAAAERDLAEAKVTISVFLRSIVCAGCGLDYTKHPKREDGAPRDPRLGHQYDECGHWVFLNAHDALKRAGLPCGPGDRS